MYAVKESSTNQLNRNTALTDCPVTFTLDKIGGRWKALIIYQMRNGPMRYSALRKVMPAITEKMLIQKLKELEADRLIIREAKPIVPPSVSYRLTEAGLALKPIMQALADWGMLYLNRKQHEVLV